MIKKEVDFYNYKIQTTSEKSLVQMLIDAKVADLSLDGKTLLLRIKQMDPVSFKNGFNGDRQPILKMAITKEKDEDGKEIQTLSFKSKWLPDDRIVDIISKALPNEILKTSRTLNNNVDFFAWYEQKGVETTSSGECIMGGLPNIPIRNVKDLKNGMYQVKIPLGYTTKNWGKVVIPAENIMFKYDENGYKSKAMIFFTKNEVEIQFGNKKPKECPLEEVMHKFKQNQQFYNNFSVDLYGIPEDNFSFLTSDCKVTIPCLKSESDNYKMTLFLKRNKVASKLGKLTLGRVRESTKVEFLKDGKICRKYISNPKILEMYNEAMKHARQEIPYLQDYTYDASNIGGFEGKEEELVLEENEEEYEEELVLEEDVTEEETNFF